MLIKPTFLTNQYCEKGKKMRVLHIINSLHTGGAEKLLVDSLPSYESHGVNADILLLNSDETPFLAELKKNFKGNIFYTHIKSYYSPLQPLAIKKYLNQNYDIIHCHLFPVLYWTALVKLASKTDTKLVFTEHSTKNRRIDNPLFLRFDKIVYSAYDKITAITPEVANVLKNKLNIQDDKIITVINGVNIAKFTCATAYDKNLFFDNASIILIQISRFQRAKDQKTLIQSLVYLPPYYKLLLVGDGEQKSDCETLVKTLNLQARVKFLGVRTDTDKLLKTSDIVVQSSHWEGFGLAAVEGMAAGKPIIASDVDGLNNIVDNYGLLFEQGNEKDLAAKILKLENDEVYDDISKKCAMRAKDFDISKMVENFITLYKNLSK